jgi:uncharacterized membrane protein (DUF4010 family)
MAGRAVNNPVSLPAAVAGAAFSTVATFAQMALVLAVVSQPTQAMMVMLVVAAFLKDRYGESGVIAGAMVAGFIDTHSAAISVASLAAENQMTPQEAMAPILAAMTSNGLAKVAIAAGTGSMAFAVRIVPGLALSIAAAWVVAVPMLLR